MAGEVEVVPGSLQGAAATLHGVARDLHVGQFEPVLLDWAADPASHPEVARAMQSFGEFAHDQYRDAVALLSALATRTQEFATQYGDVDAATGQDMTTFLTGSVFQPAGQQPG